MASDALSAAMAQSFEIPAAMARWLEPFRYKIARGGRGGGKSRTIAGILVREGARRRLRWLCAREVQKSIEESVYRLLADEIERQGLQAHYDIQKTRIIGRYTGTTFVFTGLREHTKDSLKSYEDYDGVWVEEAHSVVAASWEILIPTFRRDATPDTPGSEVWISYNPDDENDAVEVMVRDARAQNDPDFLIVDINWRDNPWFPKVLEKERLRMLRQNVDLYNHVWEGHCRSAAGILFKRDWFLRHDRAPARLNTYAASDYAVTTDGGDFTEHGVAGMAEDGILYFTDWWSGQSAPDVWIEAMLSMVRRHKPQVWFEEKGVILRSVEPMLKRAMTEAKTYVRREGLPSASNKAARALGFVAMASCGKVSFPKTQWADRVINQLCAFTGEPGRVDDAVDVCSLLARGLEDIHNARPADAPKPKAPKPFTEDWFSKLDRRDAEAQESHNRYYQP